MRRTRELLAEIGEVHLVLAGANVGEILGVNAERLLELARIAGEQTAALEGHEQPFVRVERHGVGALDPAERLRARFGERGEPGVRGVDVHPELLARA